MAQAKQGDKVKVHYTGKLKDGTVFDSSSGREPIEFTIGTGQVIPGFEEGVVGMQEGDKKTVEVPVDLGYGPRRDDLVANFKKSQFPPDITPEVGQRLQMQQPDGKAVQVTVTDVGDEEVTLDANHPLAGEDLTFEVELVEVAA